jgi:exopolyphosphatase/guanosine-5'-triphosphate,3'-diphosphate pyrophosphatase
VDEKGKLHFIHHEQRLPRLGKNVDANGNIQVAAFDRASWILTEYSNLAKQYRTDALTACATSAVRDAANQEEFLSHIKRTTGINVEVLNGDEEALWTYRGALSGFPPLQNAAVLDIGGGSTELTFTPTLNGNGHSLLTRYSFQLGSVRLTERYFKHLPPMQNEIVSAAEVILEELAEVRNPGLERYQLIGVAGTATTLACLDQQLQEFDREKVSGYSLSYDRVSTWLMKLSGMATDDIRTLSNATEGRADILTAGVLILHEIMKQFRFSKVLVSERGLRYGLVLREWELHHK